MDALALLLPSSRLAPLFDSLPEPEPTAPNASSIHELQLQVQRSFDVLEEMIALIEGDEQRRIEAEVKRRRTRLTGTPMSAEETTKAVSREVMATSRLPALYEAALEHPQASDSARRGAEAKLLDHLVSLLTSIPSPFAPVLESARSEVQIEEHRRALDEAKAEKARLRERIDELVRGMIILRIPNELAWRIALDWHDVAAAGPSREDLRG